MNATIDRTPLHLAVINQNLTLDFLIEQKEFINSKDIFGQTPLYWAVKLGYNVISKLLIEHGSDVNAINNDGKSILYQTPRNSQLFNILIDHGAKIIKVPSKKYFHC